MDVELSGERPQPRSGAAVEMIDQHRGLLHGGYAGGEPLDDAFVIDLIEKVKSNYVCPQYLINSFRSGFVSIFFQNHLLGLITKSVNYQKQDLLKIVFYLLAGLTEENFQTMLAFLTLNNENLTRYKIITIDNKFDHFY